MHAYAPSDHFHMVNLDQLKSVKADWIFYKIRAKEGGRLRWNESLVKRSSWGTCTD